MRILIEDRISSTAQKLAWRLLPGPVNSLFNENAALLKKGYLSVQGKKISIRTVVDWSELNKLGRSEQRIAHMNAFIGDAVRTYQDTADQGLLTAALDMALLWADAHAWEGQSTGMAYHDETTARRVAYWTKLLIASRITQTEPECALRLEERLSQEVFILSQDSFYAGKNNHGMFQNFAILYYCSLVEYSEPRVQVALHRLLDYFEWSVAKDGVHKEHSPSYNYLIARNMAAHVELFRSFDTDAAQRIKLILKRMARYALNIVSPEGCYPPLGDTPPTAIPRNYRKTFSDSEPFPCVEDCVVFEEGGYAILRDGNKTEVNQTFAVFSASHHGSYHKHADDLGLILYSNGWIISESGPYGYDYSHPLSKHAYSTAGHSTLHIPTLRQSSEAGKVGILSWSHQGPVSVVHARNLRYEQLVHERTVNFDRSRTTISVLDNIYGAADHRKYILWQLASDLVAIKNGLCVYLFRKQQIVACLILEGDVSPDAIILGRGSSHKEIHGYRFPDFGQVEETTVLAILSPVSKETWLLSTSIHLQDARPSPKDGVIEPTVSISWGVDFDENRRIVVNTVCDELTIVAFYLYCDGKIAEKRPYTSCSTAIFDIPSVGGTLFVRAFFQRDNQLLTKINSTTISIPALC